MEKVLSETEMSFLRSRNLILNSEIAIKIGDLFIAENIVTRERRVLENAASVLNESRRVLKG